VFRTRVRDEDFCQDEVVSFNEIRALIRSSELMWSLATRVLAVTAEDYVEVNRVGYVPVHRVLYYPWNRLRYESLLKADIKKVLEREPVELTAYEAVDGNHVYTVTDGNHRCAVAEAHGLMRVRAIVGAVCLLPRKMKEFVLMNNALWKKIPERKMLKYCLRLGDLAEREDAVVLIEKLLALRGIRLIKYI